MDPASYPSSTIQPLPQEVTGPNCSSLQLWHGQALDFAGTLRVESVQPEHGPLRPRAERSARGPVAAGVGATSPRTLGPAEGRREACWNPDMTSVLIGS